MYYGSCKNKKNLVLNIKKFVKMIKNFPEKDESMSNPLCRKGLRLVNFFIITTVQSLVRDNR